MFFLLQINLSSLASEAEHSRAVQKRSAVTQVGLEMVNVRQWYPLVFPWVWAPIRGGRIPIDETSVGCYREAVSNLTQAAGISNVDILLGIL